VLLAIEFCSLRVSSKAREVNAHQFDEAWQDNQKETSRVDCDDCVIVDDFMRSFSMPAESDFADVFADLKKILQTYAKLLVVQKDDEKSYCLDSSVIGKNKKPVSFAFAVVQKNYVSFHLMPVYGCQDMVEEMSPELRAHMQGKACFNFKTREPALFKELARLTKAGFERFKKIGFI
jgi:hypothetical protein